jgi:hypothetical protein
VKREAYCEVLPEATAKGGEQVSSGAGEQEKKSRAEGSDSKLTFLVRKYLQFWLVFSREVSNARRKN